MDSSRLRVLHLCSYYSSPFYRLLFNALASLDIDQKVFYPAVRGTSYDGMENDVVFDSCYQQLDRIFFGRKSDKVLQSLYRHIDVSLFNMVHAHSLFSNGYIALSIKKRFGIPYIAAVRNTDVYSFFRLRPWLRSLGIDIMLQSSAVIFISGSYRDTVFQKYIPSRYRDILWKKSHVIPNGINRKFLEDQPMSLMNSDGVIHVLQVGDLTKNKNQLTAAKACKILHDRGNSIEYVAIGKARETEIKEKLMKLANVEVKAPMAQSELLNEYRKADVFIMPSFHETFGLAYVEAMSQGLPVIYSKGQGFDGWFNSGKVGASVDPANPKEIAEAILDCYARRATLFEANKQAAHYFDWSRIADQYEAIYRSGLYAGESCE